MEKTILDGLFIMKDEGSEMLRKIKKDEFIHFVLDTLDTDAFINELIEMENYGDQLINVFTLLLSDEAFFNRFKEYKVFKGNSDAFYLLPAYELECILDLTFHIDRRICAEYFNSGIDCYSYVNESIINYQIDSFINLLRTAIQNKKSVLFAFRLIH